MKDIVIPINVERPEDFDQAVEKVKIRAVQLGITAKPRIRPKAGTVTYRVAPGCDEQLIKSALMETARFVLVPRSRLKPS
jgi:hypothetical protein